MSKSNYRHNPEKQKALSKLSYRANTQKFKAAFKMNYAKNRDVRIKSVKTYYTDNEKTKCANERNKYVLAEPKLYVKEQYLKEIQFNLLDDSIAWLELFKAYKKEHVDLAKRMSKNMSKAICKIAAKKYSTKHYKCVRSM